MTAGISIVRGPGGGGESTPLGHITNNTSQKSLDFGRKKNAHSHRCQFMQGLETLDYHATVPTPPQNLRPNIEEQQASCDPHEAIPLHYEPLQPTNTVSQEGNATQKHDDYLELDVCPITNHVDFSSVLMNPFCPD